MGRIRRVTELPISNAVVANEVAVNLPSPSSSALSTIPSDLMADVLDIKAGVPGDVFDWWDIC
ncbi:hypothetical protein M5K25_023636 [Dendrobium thyrsiflorum]|uniref:Uncharacterized protein n=1 Tax=Dendrobium thyrsiflorum TaxID=117978 RepID=A0ABD0U997_DENTH